MTNAVKKYVTVTRHKEMISNSMFHYIALSKRASDNSFILTVVDLITLGCYLGFQKLEWCSDHHGSFATIDDPNLGPRPTALSTIASDFTFNTESRHRVHDPASSPDHGIVFALLCFRKQKNNNNGQTLSYCCRSDFHWPAQDNHGLTGGRLPPARPQGLRHTSRPQGPPCMVLPLYPCHGREPPPLRQVL